MLKILNTDQIKQLDAYTIRHEPIASIDLMERACKAFSNWFIQRVDVTKKIGIVCGTGNNGGDGLGIARILSEWDYPVKVWILRGAAPETEDFKTNLDRIRNKLDLTELKSDVGESAFADREILIDALFGSGLSRPAEGVYAQAIRRMNEANAMRIAVDIPSGLAADKPSTGEIVRAHYTITFQLPKLAFFLPQSYPFVGDWDAVDIGLDKQFIKDTNTSFFQVRPKDVKKILKPRSKFDHKGVFGHALLISGGFGKMGAAVLASRAVLRSGVGLLTAHIPGCGYEIIQTAVPEAMADVDSHETLFSEVPAVDKYDVVGVGPGLGQDPITIKAFARLLETFRKPMVIDADALNILGGHKELFKLIPAGSILTPHPKEFERLTSASENDFEKLEKQISLAQQLNAVIILKGAYSSIATPDGKVYFNSTGNPGMATGGTGDVLTGILTGFLAQNYSPVDAAILGTYIHGLSGDIVCGEKGVESLIASDVVEGLAQAFQRISGK